MRIQPFGSSTRPRWFLLRGDLERCVRCRISTRSTCGGEVLSDLEGHFQRQAERRARLRLRSVSTIFLAVAS